jgi:hypothetical protein
VNEPAMPAHPARARRIHSQLLSQAFMQFPLTYLCNEKLLLFSSELNGAELMKKHSFFLRLWANWNRLQRGVHGDRNLFLTFGNRNQQKLQIINWLHTLKP